MLLYHLSPKPALEVLEPEAPDLLENVKEAGTKVVKFAPTINGFLNIIGPLNVPMSYDEYGKDRDKGYYSYEENKDAIDKEIDMFYSTLPVNMLRKEEDNIEKVVHVYPQFYVYIPDPSEEDVTFYVPTSKEVFNQTYTGEVDIFRPIRVKCIGSIMVISKAAMKEMAILLKWKGHNVYYMPYSYEYIRYDPDHVFLSDIYKTRDDYDDFTADCESINNDFTAINAEYARITGRNIDDCGYTDEDIERCSDRIEQMEMSRKSDPVPPTRSKPKQRNQYSLPKKKKEIVLKK